MKILSTTDEHDAFLSTIGETPETVYTRQAIRDSKATVYCVGEADDFSAAVVQWHVQPKEPMGFGTSGTDLWATLQQVSGWEVINVPLTMADDLAKTMTADDTNIDSVRRYGDIYYTLTRPAIAPAFDDSDIDIRLLTVDDAEMMHRAPRELQRANGFVRIEDALRQNSIACGIVDNEIVAISQTVGKSETMIEVGVHTAEAYRGKGISTQASYLVCQQIQAQGKLPVWSTGEDNWASQKVAQKIGFEEVSRRVYLIPQRPA
ncbi:MAG: GNAT family N-acetyltransferase [Chloroflexota bacterium]